MKAPLKKTTRGSSLVDKALEVANNKIIIAHINGEFTVKRIAKKGQKVILTARITTSVK